MLIVFLFVQRYYIFVEKKRTIEQERTVYKVVQCFVEKKKSKGYYEEKKPELLYVSRVNAEDCVHPRIMHAHKDFIEIILIRDGEGSFMINGTNYHVKKGDLVLLNSNMVHDEYGDEVSHYACAVSGVRKDGMRDNAIIPDDQVPVIPSGKMFGSVNGMMSQMFYMMCGDVPGAEECCTFLLEALLTQVEKIAQHEVQYRKKELTDRAFLALQIKEYIDENYMNDISLGTISEQLHISLYYLAHTFKEFYQYSPMQYVIRRRIGEAQSLLISTNLTVTRIAMMVGCDNPNHFNTIFSKNVGISPRNYRLIYQSRENEDLSYTVV